MEKPILKNEEQYPSEEVVYSHIGVNKTLWIQLFEFIHKNHPDFSEEWRYYNDGKNWLKKVTKKSKTIFWLSVFKDTFKITFYLADKAEEHVFNSDISDELKGQFRNGKHYGKIRGLTITFSDIKDIDYAISMIAIRLKN